MNIDMIIVRVISMLWLLLMVIAFCRVRFLKRKSLTLGSLFVTIFQINSGPNPCNYSRDSIETIEISDKSSNMYISK